MNTKQSRKKSLLTAAFPPKLVILSIADQPPLSLKEIDKKTDALNQTVKCVEQKDGANQSFCSALRRSARLQAAIVKSASDEELSAVSHESWSTPMMKPTATTCMAVF